MDDEHILTLAHWLSPAFPVGAFAYSHGLEAAVDLGWVADASGLEAWLVDILECGAGRADALLLAAAYRAGSETELAEIDATARAFAASRERLLETDRMGAAFSATTASVWGTSLADLTYPVAIGRAAAMQGIARDLTAKLYLQAFAANLIAAGQRLLPLGQTEAQAMLRRLIPLCIRIADMTCEGDLSGLSSSAFLGDIAAMRHETQYSRIFRT